MSATRKKDSKKRMIRIIVIAAAVTAVLTAVVLILKAKVAEEYGSGSQTQIQTGTASLGSISMTVSGSGNLTDEDAEKIELPASVEIEEVCVEAGDTVEKGDLLAKVDMPSVVSSMSDLQSEMDELDEQIKDASNDAADSSVKAAVSGRVKVIYAQKGDDVATVMYENGALAVLSLDGYMAADIETDKLNAGDDVTVETADGTRYEGSVSSADDKSATVLIADDGPEYGETVSVYDSEGADVGSGTLYIHEPLSITGYAGTVAGVSVSENSRVSSGKQLFLLTDTEYSGSYNSLLARRSELEDCLMQLLTVYKEGAVYSVVSGSVSAVGEESSASSSSDTSGTYSVQSTDTSQAVQDTEDEIEMQTVLSICPGKTMTVLVSVDESSILSLQVGQEAAVSVDSLEGEEFTGTVTGIDTTGISSGGVTSYTAEITLDKAEKMLSGMSASVNIKIEGVENALLIPSDALTQTSSSSYVYTSYDEQSQELGGMTEVTTGLDNGTYVEITGGLDEGDTVYYMASEEEGFGNMRGGMNFGGGNMAGGMDFSGGNMPGQNMPGGMPREG